MGETTRTRVTKITKVTKEVVTKVTKEVVEVSRREDITPMQTQTRVVDPVAGETNTTPHRETFPLLLPLQIRIKVRTFVLMTWLLSLIMISIIRWMFMSKNNHM